MGDDDAAEVARLRAEVERLTRERDALLGLLVKPYSDHFGGYFAVTAVMDRSVSIVTLDGCCIHDALCQYFSTEARAVAAVRRAAGLGAEGEGGLSDG
jgi:hypothetical protein